MQDQRVNGTIAGSLGALDDLTPQQFRIALLLGEGRSLAAITQRLSIAQSTLDKHLARLRDKLEVESTIEVAALAARASLSKPSSSLESAAQQPSTNKDAECRVPGCLNDVLAAALANHLDLHPLEEVEAVAYRFLPRGRRSLRVGSALGALVGPAQIDTSGQIIPDADTLRELDRQLIRWAEVSGEPRPLQSKSEIGSHHLIQHICFRDGPSLVGFSFYKRKSFASRAHTAHAANWEESRDVEKLFTWSKAFHEIASRGRGLVKAAGLTRSECETLGLIAQGETVQGISQRQGGAERNVARILRRVRKKLHARTNAEAVAEAMALHALEFS